MALPGQFWPVGDVAESPVASPIRPAPDMTRFGFDSNLRFDQEQEHTSFSAAGRAVTAVRAKTTVAEPLVQADDAWQGVEELKDLNGSASAAENQQQRQLDVETAEIQLLALKQRNRILEDETVPDLTAHLDAAEEQIRLLTAQITKGGELKKQQADTITALDEQLRAALQRASDETIRAEGAIKAAELLTGTAETFHDRTEAAATAVEQRYHDKQAADRIEWERWHYSELQRIEGELRSQYASVLEAQDNKNSASVAAEVVSAQRGVVEAERAAAQREAMLEGRLSDLASCYDVVIKANARAAMVQQALEPDLSLWQPGWFQPQSLTEPAQLHQQPRTVLDRSQSPPGGRSISLSSNYRHLAGTWPLPEPQSNSPTLLYLNR